VNDLIDQLLAQEEGQARQQHYSSMVAPLVGALVAGANSNSSRQCSSPAGPVHFGGCHYLCMLLRSHAQAQPCSRPPAALTLTLMLPFFCACAAFVVAAAVAGLLLWRRHSRRQAGAAGQAAAGDRGGGTGSDLEKGTA
jgi:hypothetical protein